MSTVMPKPNEAINRDATNGEKFDRLKASDWTFLKQQAFSVYLQNYAPIASAIQQKYRWVGRWLYVELTAGSGLIDNGNTQISGSPLIALEAFRKQLGLAVDCLFIEHNPKYAAELGRVLNLQYSTWSSEERIRIKFGIQCCDHRDFLNRTIARHSMALVYWDGLGGDVYPAGELKKWLLANSRHDLLVMASGTAQKRMGSPRLDQVLKTTPRSVWLSDTNGAWQWIFALCTSWEPLPKKISSRGTLPFFASNSPKGKEILDKLATTEREREERDQMRLW